MPDRQLPVRTGPGANLANTPLGRMVSVMPEVRGWHHPWFTRLIWLPSSNGLPGSGRWVATVQPGLVGGRCPVVLTTVDEAKADAEVDYGINPLSGKPYFSDPIFKKPGEKVTGSFTVPIPLYMRPAIRPQWRSLGWDSTSGAIPSFFKDRGVNPPPPNNGLSLDGEPTNSADAIPPKGNRLLRAADLILHQPRMALTSSIELQPGPVTGISNVTQTLGLRSAAPGDKLKVFSGKIADATATDIDPLAGDYEEPNFDELLISTVYLLSPADCPPGSAPDNTWSPFVRHNLFWNLTHIIPVFEITAQDLANAFASLVAVGQILGGGAASIGINFVAAGINDQARQALNMITAHSMAGTFYTATGGGSTSVMPVDPESQSGIEPPALGKSARQVEERRAAIRAKRSARLDPPFPYEGRQFPVSFLQ